MKRWYCTLLVLLILGLGNKQPVTAPPAQDAQVEEDQFMEYLFQEHLHPGSVPSEVDIR